MDIVTTNTAVGHQAVAAGLRNGEPVVVTEVQLGSGAYVPSEGQTELVAPFATIPIAATAQNDTQVQFSAIADGPEEGTVNELGFFLSDGTLLSVWSDPELTVGFKTPIAEFVANLNLNIASFPKGSVVVQASETPLDLTQLKPLLALAIGHVVNTTRSIQQIYRTQKMELAANV